MFEDFPFDVPEFPRVPEPDHWLFIFGRLPFGWISLMTDRGFMHWVDIHEIKTVETPGPLVVGVLSNWVVTGEHSSKSDSLMIPSYLDIPPIPQSPCLTISFQTCNQNEYFFQKILWTSLNAIPLVRSFDGKGLWTFFEQCYDHLALKWHYNPLKKKNEWIRYG